MINLVYKIDKLSLNEIIHIWKYISRFKPYNLNINFFLEQNVDQHYLTSLIYKLDWMNTNGYKIHFNILFKNQYTTIQDYLSTKEEIDYYIEISQDVFFSNQFPESLMRIIDNGLSFNIENVLIGINKKDPENKQIDLDYMVILDTELANSKQPHIWVFKKDLNENFKNSWFSQIRENYINGVELFYEYRS